MGFSRVKGTFCASINSGICPKSCHNFAEIISFEAVRPQLFEAREASAAVLVLLLATLFAHSTSITNLSNPIQLT